MPPKKKSTAKPVAEALPVAVKISAKTRRINQQLAREIANRQLRKEGKPTAWDAARRKRRARRADLQWATPGPLDAQTPDFIAKYRAERAARRRLASR